jgi:biotin-(acetyl-CoA carboxylase) ligase
MDELNHRCNILSLVTGKDVSVDTGGENIKGKAFGIDKDGGLLLKGQDGNIRKILNGDVSLSF